MEGSDKSIDRPTVALENVKTPEDFLNAVDFQTINQIFESLVQKARQKRLEGAPSLALSKEKVRMHMTTPEGVPETVHGWVDFKVTQDGRVTASYPQESWEEIVKKHPGNEGLQALHTLIHEYAHIRNGVRNNPIPGKWKNGAIEGEKIEVDLGFVSRVLVDGETVEESGAALNEAVTEEIALEVMNEYMRRTGNRKLLDAVMAQKMNRSYRPSRFILNTLMETMAERLAIPREQVWEGFVAGFLNQDSKVTEFLTHISLKLDRNKDLDPLIGHLLSSFPLSKHLGFSEEDLKKQTEEVLLHNPVAPEKALQKVFEVLRLEEIEDALGLRK